MTRPVKLFGWLEDLKKPKKPTPPPRVFGDDPRDIRLLAVVTQKWTHPNAYTQNVTFLRPTVPEELVGLTLPTEYPTDLT